jgi:hypothetical protein
MRVFLSSLRCFFLAMRLRRFLMTEPTGPPSLGTAVTGTPTRSPGKGGRIHTRPRGYPRYGVLGQPVPAMHRTPGDREPRRNASRWGQAARRCFRRAPASQPDSRGDGNPAGGRAVRVQGRLSPYRRTRPAGTD